MEAVQSWLKATPKSFFSGGHPQACGQLDRVCCEAGGTVSKNKTQTISVSTLVKQVIIKFLLSIPDLPSCIHTYNIYINSIYCFN